MKSVEMRPPSEYEPRPPSFASAVYRPKFALTNEEIEGWNVMTRTGHLNSKRIVKAVGSVKRYVADETETPVRMGLEAAHEALRGRNSVDVLMVSGSFPDGVDWAKTIAGEMGLKPSTKLNIHMACSGGVAGFSFLDRHDKRDYRFQGANVLHIATEKYQPYLHDLRGEGVKYDPSLAQTIFSDGATAMFFQYGKDLQVLASQNTLFPPEIQALIRMPIDRTNIRGTFLEAPVPLPESGRFEQEGAQLYRFIKGNIKKLVDEIVCKANVTPEDVSGVFPHQGSRHMTEGIADVLEETYGVVYHDFEEGNFSSGSISKSLTRAVNQGELKAGDTAVLVGFGAGGMASTAVVKFAA